MTRPLLALCAAVLLSLAGCGSDETAASAPTTSATKAPSTPTQTPAELVNQKAAEASITLAGGPDQAAVYVQAACDEVKASQDRPATLRKMITSTVMGTGPDTLDGNSLLLYRLGFPELCPEYVAPLEDVVSAPAPPPTPEPPATAPGPGTYDVGTGPGQVPPGKYRTTDVSDCYWERTSRGGEILNNQFATRAQEITVTIRRTDGSFTSRSCGTWTKVA